jgi:hypothetical protein
VNACSQQSKPVFGGALVKALLAPPVPNPPSSRNERGARFAGRRLSLLHPRCLHKVPLLHRSILQDTNQLTSNCRQLSVKR